MSTHDPLPAPGQSRDLLIPGPAGRIEALLAAPRMPLTTPALAIVCHPHPLFGGAMSNKVAYTLASCANKAGAHALRFNFRGVGRSEGLHDEGRGETDDVVFLAGWARAHVPGARIVLMGFSFGAFVSLKAASRLGPVAQVSIAPPFGKYFGNAPLPARPPCPWLVVHARDDDVVPYAESHAIVQGYSPPVEMVTLDEGGHFFHGRLAALTEAVAPFLQRHLQDTQGG